MRDTATASGAGPAGQAARDKAAAPDTAMPEAPMPHGGTPPGGSPPPRGPQVAYLAALAALAGIPIHLYWAAGGTWGLPGGAAAAGLPGVRATNLAVSVLLACGAAFLYGLTRPWSRRPFGMATKSLYAGGVQSAVAWPGHLTAGQKNLAALYDLGVFEPWFLIQGLLLALAGRWFARTATGCRRWTLSLAAGIVLIDAFGIALAVTQHRFAVS